MSGIVYFIQPVEHLNTNRFKIGCSTHADLRRLKKYSIGTIYYLVIAVDEPFAVESQLKKSFNEKFMRFGTTETYEGEREVMMGTFLHIVLPQYISEPDNKPQMPLPSKILGLFTRLFRTPPAVNTPTPITPVNTVEVVNDTFQAWIKYFLTIFSSTLMNIEDKEIPAGTYRFQSKVLYEDYTQYTAYNKLSKNNFYKYLREYCVDHTNVVYIKKYKGYPAYDFIS